MHVCMYACMYECIEKNMSLTGLVFPVISGIHWESWNIFPEGKEGLMCIRMWVCNQVDR